MFGPNILTNFIHHFQTNGHLKLVSAKNKNSPLHSNNYNVRPGPWNVVLYVNDNDYSPKFFLFHDIMIHHIRSFVIKDFLFKQQPHSLFINASNIGTINRNSKLNLVTNGSKINLLKLGSSLHYSTNIIFPQCFEIRTNYTQIGNPSNKSIDIILLEPSKIK